MELKYGEEAVELPFPRKNIMKILHMKKIQILSNPEHKIKELLKEPINSFSLNKLILQKKAQKILIVVNDATRLFPYKIIVTTLIE